MCSRGGPEIGGDVSLDVEAFARFVWRLRGRREERRASELWRLFHQPDQGWRILGHANDLDLVTLDSQLRYIGIVGQNAGDRFEHHHARRRGLLALRQQSQRRSWRVGV